MIKNLVREFKDGTNKCYIEERLNVVNGGRAIKQSGDSYYFYCDGVMDEALEEFCQEHHLGWDITVVPSKRMNVYGTKERVIVSMWRTA